MADYFDNPWTQMGVGMLSRGGRIGPGLQRGMENVQQQRTLQQQKEIKDMQMRQMQSQLEMQRSAQRMRQNKLRRQRQGSEAFMIPGAPASVDASGLPIAATGPTAPQTTEEVRQGLLRMMQFSDNPAALASQAAGMGKPEYKVVGGNLVRTDTPTPSAVFTAPQKPVSPGATLQGYQYAKGQGYPGSFVDYQKEIGASKRASQTTNVYPGSKGITKLAEKQAASLTTRQDEAQDDIVGVQNIHSAAERIKSGMITGFGGNLKLNLARFAEFAGLGGKDANEKIANTETYMAQMGNEVGRVIKQFGAGTGLSDADREYAEKIVGGRISLNEKSLMRILQIQEKVYRARITAHNKRAGQVLKKPGAETGLLYNPSVDVSMLPEPLTFDAPPPVETAPMAGGGWGKVRIK